LRHRKPSQRWLALLLATLGAATLLSWAQVSAAVLLAALLAGIAVAALEGRVEVPAWPYRLAQGVVGCLIARNITPHALGSVRAQWPIMAFGILSVVACSAALGALLARWKVLPGSTAVWGATPGAATAMVLMAESFGADVRLVAFMQYLRVVLVALVASLVTRWWVPDLALSPVAAGWFQPVALLPLAETLAVSVVGALLGTLLGMHAGALLVPLVLAASLAALDLLTITLPPWLL
jgi:membrane AbrB-like protein